MRIDAIELTAFGPFAGRRLDFGQGTEGVHVVFGANEAGKSSALRAIRDALFGIPARSNDNFLHPYDALRIGFSLRSADGRRFSAIRLKRLKNPLLDPRTEAPLEESTLAALLGGVDRQAFERMFGLDTDALRAGGREIARMQGDVGGALFAAAGGLVRLRRIREALDEEAAAIFKPRGQNQSLNAAIGRFNTLKARLKDERRSSRDHKEKTDELDRARQEAREAGERLRNMRSERSLVERIAKSRRLIAALDTATTAIGDLAGVRLLREGFAEDLRKATAACLSAEAGLAGAGRALERIERELGQLPRPTIPAEHWPAARHLPDLLGAFRKARADLPGIQRKAQADRTALETRLERLGAGVSLDDYPTLFISPVDRQRITSIGSRMTTARAAESTTAEELKRAERQRGDAEAALRAIPQPVDTRALEAAMTAAGRKGDVEEELDALTRRRAAEAEEIGLLLERAGRWAGTLERLRAAALPTATTVDAHDTVLAERGSALRLAREARDRAAADHARLSAEREGLLAVEGDLPTEGDVAVAREARDGLWQAIRECWLGGGSDVVAAEAHGADRGDLRGAGEAYDGLVGAADAVVDRVRREHTRVGARARLESDLRAKARELATAEGAIAAAAEALEQATREWREAWRPVGVEAGTTREMREWLGEIATIRTRADRLDQSEDEIRRLGEFVAASSEAVGAALVAIGGMEPDGIATLAGRLARGRELVRDQVASREERAGLETARQKAKERVDELTEQLESKRDQRAAVEGEWARALADRGMPAGLDTTAADAWMTECMDIHGQAHQLLGADGAVARIRHIEKDFDSFVAHVADLLRRVGETAAVPDLESVEDLAAGLLERIDRSKNDASAIADAEKRLTAAAGDRDARRTERDASRAAMAALEVEAGAGEGADLALACERSNVLRTLEREAAKLEADLAELAGGMTTEEWTREVRSRDGEDLALRLAEATTAIDSLDEEKEAKNQAVGRLTNELAAVGAGTDAVDGSAEMQARLGEIETHTRGYARLWIASRVLRRAVDAYRERNQGDVLRVASDHFAKLTQGAFEGLTIDYADETPVIAGRRAGQAAPVRVEAMSEGTTDQLFLALRLAYIDLRARHHEPMPLILDDVLGTYDDARAAATLQAFADVSRTTQVILFTHHRHLLPIAEASVPRESLFIQDLSG